MVAVGSALEGMQAGCSRFVAEMHDNAKETEAFLKGLGGGSGQSKRRLE
jgi:hypothetical protein